MSPLWVVIGALAVVWIASIVAARRRQQERLAALRASWGQPRRRARDLKAIAEYHRSRADPTSSRDDRTWNDLDLDAVFATIDRTGSTLGQQALYHRLRTAPVADHLEAFAWLADRMGEDVAARERAQVALSRLQDPAGYDLWWITQPDALDTRPWHALFPLLALGMLASLALITVWPGALLLAIVGIVINLNVRIATGGRVGAVVGSFRQIGPLLATADALAFLDDGGGTHVKPITGALRHELSALKRLRTIAGWASRDPLSMDQLTAMVLEYFNVLLLLDLNALYFAARELRVRGEALRRVMAAVGDVDAAIAVASFRAGAPRWTRPRVLTPTPGEPAAARMTDLCHPLIDAPVPNSIELAPSHGVLVTGSNMSGKTTFLRTVGVNAILAQTIDTCLASGYSAPILTVRSCIGRTDDLTAGKSYYLVEVEAVLALVRASASTTTPHLFLLDELFRGTNAVERVAAAEAVLTELAVEPHIVLVSTHDDGLVELLRDRYVPFHFAEQVGPDGLVFDHRLRPGPATTRNAIALLRLHGAPDRLVSRALARAASLDPRYSLDR